MTQKDLSSLFPESCRIGNLILLVSPELFYKLEGLTITGSRMFMMLCQGHMTLTLNDRPYELGAHSYFDIMETTTARIDSTSPDVFSAAVSPADPIIEVIMLAISIEVCWMVSG